MIIAFILQRSLRMLSLSERDRERERAPHTTGIRLMPLHVFAPSAYAHALALSRGHALFAGVAAEAMCRRTATEGET